jgi:prephenate dehydratase
MTEREIVGPRIGYEGKPGSEIELAILVFRPDARPVAYERLTDLLTALGNGDVHRIFVPVENSRLGPIATTYDALLDHSLTIEGELIQRSGSDASDDILRGNASSIVRYVVLASGEWDIGRTIDGPAAGKTSVVFAVGNKAGALVRALSCFSRQQLNLSGLTSRPAPQRPWEHIFFVDVEGYATDSKVQSAVRELRRLHSFVRTLGSYPVSDLQPRPIENPLASFIS